MPWLASMDARGTSSLRGSEGGTIIVDEEHDDYGARITLEANTKTAQAAITCGLYGWMVHTRLFGTLDVALREYEAMKIDLAIVGSLIPKANDTEVEQKSARLLQAISTFEEKFPS